MQFLLNGRVMQLTNRAPYTWQWDTFRVPTDSTLSRSADWTRSWRSSAPSRPRCWWITDRGDPPRRSPLRLRLPGRVRRGDERRNASRCAEIRIFDLTHGTPPQDILAGALNLASAVPYCPGDTLFVAVVDPGVGGPRRGLCVRSGGRLLVGPDNGLLWPAAHPAKPWSRRRSTSAKPGTGSQTPARRSTAGTSSPPLRPSSLSAALPRSSGTP